jgi:hypothetical protein
MHNPQCVQLSFGSMKSSLRFSPIGVGGEKNRFSGHTSTQSLHLMHKILSTTIFFKEIHHNSFIAYLFTILNLKLSKTKFNFIPTTCKFFLNV